MPDEHRRRSPSRTPASAWTTPSWSKNLGTIAHSGSREFLKQVQEKKDVNLIGQFGVGFYSAYLVADRVEVVSRARSRGRISLGVGGQAGASRWSRPSAKARHGGHPAPQGGAEGVLEACRLRQLVARYSDYVGYPIELGTKKDDALTFDRVNQGERAVAAAQARSPTSSTRSSTSTSPTTGNRRSVARTSVSKARRSSRACSSSRSARRSTSFSPEEQHGVRLFVKRVFIMDDCEELLPRWLRFVRGVVDSDDLPLNVSRELLQDSEIVRAIRKQVVKQVLDLLEEIAEKRPDDYAALFKSFGTVLKEGLTLDPEYKEKLAKLLRYESSKAEGQLRWRTT